MARTLRGPPRSRPRVARGFPMSSWELLFVSWACLGDASILGRPIRPIPEPLRPAAAAVRFGAGEPLCRIRPELERWPARRDALRRLRELGPGPAPRLRFCRAWKCWDRAVEWRPGLFVAGEEIKLEGR